MKQTDDDSGPSQDLGIATPNIRNNLEFTFSTPPPSQQQPDDHSTGTIVASNTSPCLAVPPTVQCGLVIKTPPTHVVKGYSQSSTASEKRNETTPANSQQHKHDTPSARADITSGALPTPVSTPQPFKLGYVGSTYEIDQEIVIQNQRRAGERKRDADVRSQSQAPTQCQIVKQDRESIVMAAIFSAEAQFLGPKYVDQVTVSLLSLHYQRDKLELRPHESFMKFKPHNDIHLQAGAGHLVGSIPPNPCILCITGLGPFETCVTIPTIEGGHILPGTCSNCHFSGNRCPNSVTTKGGKAKPKRKRESSDIGTQRHKR